jgi:hypothetical protein
MRLWSLHPRYLDPQGLVALWREALLAKAVLAGQTRGYRHHPQLERFRARPDPMAAICAYLRGVHDEAVARGYAFDAGKLGESTDCAAIGVTVGQVDHEWRRLRGKLAVRNPAWCARCEPVVAPECHPLFRIEPGAVASWERVGPGN